MDLPFPKIYTDRLIIEPFNDSLITPEYIGWLNDKHITRYSEQRHKIHTVDSCTEYLNWMNASANLFYAIKTKDPAAHIGNLSVYYSTHNSTADVAILLGGRPYWGHGYGFEAWLALINHLEKSGVRKITAGTMRCNTGMLKIFKKSEMKIEAIKKAQYIIGNTTSDGIFAARHAAIQLSNELIK